MTAPPPGRPWWKRKRTWAVAAWLLAAYPASGGPAAFAVRRGWLPEPVIMAAYAPIIAAERRTRPFTPFGDWARACHRMAR